MANKDSRLCRGVGDWNGMKGTNTIFG